MKLPVEDGVAEDQRTSVKRTISRRKSLPEDFVLHRNMRTESRISEQKNKENEAPEIISGAKELKFDIDIPDNDDFDIKIDFSGPDGIEAEKDWYRRSKV